MAFLLFLFLGVVASSAVLDGSDLVPEKCLEGPEVWCKNLETAIECQRQEYCLALQSAPLQWEELEEAHHTLSLPKKCLMCIKMVQKLQDQLGDNVDDDAAINAAIRSTCMSLGRLVGKFCRSVMKKFKDQIVNALQNSEDAQETCGDIRLCKSPAPGIPAWL